MKILLIFTGGTISMVRNPETGALRPADTQTFRKFVPELEAGEAQIDMLPFDPLIDSSDVNPDNWAKMARAVYDHYDQYDAFVVLHGTDTMSYSASALSFMLSGLTKPVIFTGSQLPVGSPRTDGKENLVSSIEIASAKDADGRATVPEVAIFFNSRLFRGNRATKADSSSFGAFTSPNCPPLAEAGINIRYNKAAIRQYDGRPLEVQTELDTRVTILKIHPGITRETTGYFLRDPGSRAVIMETYGSGNAISKPWFTDIVSEACGKGKIILNVTQCQAGEVDMNIYATGKTLKAAGVISGRDITTEAALGKLFCLMGKFPDNKTVKELLESNLRGEISE